MTLFKPVVPHFPLIGSTLLEKELSLSVAEGLLIMSAYIVGPAGDVSLVPGRFNKTHISLRSIGNPDAVIFV